MVKFVTFEMPRPLFEIAAPRLSHFIGTTLNYHLRFTQIVSRHC